jgi:hypothetical protein
VIYLIENRSFSETNPEIDLFSLSYFMRNFSIQILKVTCKPSRLNKLRYSEQIET